MLTADYGKKVLSPSADFKDFKQPEQTIANSLGHYNEWLAACKGEDKTKTLCNFDYSGRLIEHNLLGVAAHRNGGAKLKWDAKAFEFDQASANKFLSKTYRKGWELTASRA